MKRLFKSMFIVSISIIITACGPGKLFGPTFTATTTNTLTPTITFTSTLTSTSTPTFTPTPTLTPTSTPTLTSTPRIPLSGENIKQWQIFQTLGGVSGVDIAFTPDGKLIAIAEQNKVVFYDTNSLKVQNTIITNAPVIALLISPDGNGLLAMDDHHNIRRYKLPSGELLGTSASFKNITEFCPQGQTVSAYVWGWANLFCLPDKAASFPSTPSFLGLITMAFNRDATLAALGGQDGFELVSLNNGRRGETKWHTSQGFIFGSAASFSPDGQVVALSNWVDGMIYLFNTNTGEKLATYAIGGRVEGLDYSSDGSLLAVVSNTGAKVIQLGSRQAIEIGGESIGSINDIVFSPDAHRLLTTDDVNQFKLWDIDNGSLLHKWEGEPFDYNSLNLTTYYPGPCFVYGGRVAYSPNGQYLALGDNGSIQVIDASTGEILHKLEVGRVRSLAFTPDSSQIAVGTLDFKAGQQKLTDGIQLWDVASGKLAQTLPGNVGYNNIYSYNCTTELAFTPDGQVLITSDGEHITLWDLSTGQQVQKWFDAKMQYIGSLSLSSDGTLLSASSGEVTKLWAVNGHEIAPNAFHIIPSSCLLEPFGHFSVCLKYVNNHYPVLDKLVYTTWSLVDQRPLGSFEIELAYDSPQSNGYTALSPDGKVIAIISNGSINFYAVQP